MKQYQLIRLAHQVVRRLLRDGKVTLKDGAAIELMQWVQSHPDEVTGAYKVDNHIDHGLCVVCHPRSYAKEEEGEASGTGSND